jgi:hypothetical protein
MTPPTTRGVVEERRGRVLLGIGAYRSKVQASFSLATFFALIFVRGE